MFNKNREVIDGREAIVASGLGPYSLRDTMECGQAFRYERIEGSSLLSEYQTVVGNHLIRVGQRQRGELIFFDVTDEVFDNVLVDYFALYNDLDMIRRDILSRTDSEWLRRASELASGVAILKQEPWEALLSFIISQNNNIPRIRKIVREISAEYGVNLTLQEKSCESCPLGLCNTTPCEEICKKCGRCYTFPTPLDIYERPEGLLASKPGFRYKYMTDAAAAIVEGRINPDMIAAARSYTYTVERLKQIKGVGDKVASCVALFAFANLEAFPIDVWMKRAIDLYFDGNLDPSTLGRYAGYAQQYIFHYIRNLEGEDK